MSRSELEEKDISRRVDDRREAPLSVAFVAISNGTDASMQGALDDADVLKEEGILSKASGHEMRPGEFGNVYFPGSPHMITAHIIKTIHEANISPEDNHIDAIMALGGGMHAQPVVDMLMQYENDPEKYIRSHGNDPISGDQLDYGRGTHSKLSEYASKPVITGYSDISALMIAMEPLGYDSVYSPTVGRSDDKVGKDIINQNAMRRIVEAVRQVQSRDQIDVSEIKDSGIVGITEALFPVSIETSLGTQWEFCKRADGIDRVMMLEGNFDPDAVISSVKTINRKGLLQGVSAIVWGACKDEPERQKIQAMAEELDVPFFMVSSESANDKTFGHRCKTEEFAPIANGGVAQLITEDSGTNLVIDGEHFSSVVASNAAARRVIGMARSEEDRSVSVIQDIPTIHRNDKGDFVGDIKDFYELKSLPKVDRPDFSNENLTIRTQGDAKDYWDLVGLMTSGLLDNASSVRVESSYEKMSGLNMEQCYKCFSEVLVNSDHNVKQAGFSPNHRPRQQNLDALDIDIKPDQLGRVAAKGGLEVMPVDQPSRHGTPDIPNLQKAALAPPHKVNADAVEIYGDAASGPVSGGLKQPTESDRLSDRFLDEALKSEEFKDIREKFQEFRRNESEQKEPKKESYTEKMVNLKSPGSSRDI